MKLLILITFLSSGTQYTDAIPMSNEVTTERQCQSQMQPVLAMWANAQPGDIQILRFKCVQDHGQGKA